MSITRIVPPQDSEPMPQFQRRTVPLWHILTSLLGLGPISLRWLRLVLALVREQWRVGESRAADRASYLEAHVWSTYRVGAEQARDEGVALIASIGVRLNRVRARAAVLAAEIAISERATIVGPHGELQTVAIAAEQQERLTAELEDAIASGSLVNRPSPARLHKYVWGASLVDFPVLAYFVSGVFNVDWDAVFALDGQALGSTMLPLATTLIFAALGSAGTALALSYFGRELRAYRTERGQVGLRGHRPGLPVVFAGLSATSVLGAGSVMTFRIVSDARDAGVEAGPAWFLAAFFGVVTMSINLVVFSVHFRNGSLLTEQLEHFAAQLSPNRVRQLNLQRQIDRLEAQGVELRREAEQAAVRTRAAVAEALTGGEQLILLARSYHLGCGIDAVMPDPPTIDLTPLDEMLAGLDEAWPLAAEQALLHAVDRNDDAGEAQS